ncbi:AP-1-like transcription factor [Madurella mycetomatis]|uniref:AP-1-like transcription factor n=1 Tax=Madurella mycetomatis TaxID=100816 RepID=A0A175VZY0_9PEZI|nr:AP-1-like transcription factor [Madurella mycetomatis]
MTSTRNPLQDFILTPQQQNLLFAALNSNRPSNKPANSGLNMSPLQFDESPGQRTDGMGSFQGSPDFDYDYDFTGADSGFDFSFDDSSEPKMIGELPGTQKASKSDSPETESPEKRSYPDDGEESSGAKRRESEDKVAKKPGRKPLTTEPTSKRKAQNRAAQRAFRERKEKHLKDLENKVQELEKLSQAANNENELLRAQIDKMTTELNEYKKQVTLLSSSRIAHQGPARPFGAAFFNNMNDVNFQFEFPKFGALPGPPVTNEPKKSSTATSTSAPTERRGTEQQSPTDTSRNGVSPGNSNRYSRSQSKDDFSDVAFDINKTPLATGHGTNGSPCSLDSQTNAGGATSTSSPSASSNSNMGGSSSSCGTSPEPYTQSPMGFKPVDTLATIGEEQTSFSGDLTQGLSQFSNVGLDEFHQWLPQTDFQFNPQLFGDYREPQERVLSHGFDDSFFNGALDDFSMPYGLPITDPVAPKKDLVAQIDAAKETDEPDAGGEMITCHKIWEKLNNCPKAQSGEFDLEALCADLQKKAKCSGTPGTAVVPQADFDEALKKHVWKDKDAAARVDAAAKQQQV